MGVATMVCRQALPPTSCGAHVPACFSGCSASPAPAPGWVHPLFSDLMLLRSRTLFLRWLHAHTCAASTVLHRCAQCTILWSYFLCRRREDLHYAVAQPCPS